MAVKGLRGIELVELTFGAVLVLAIVVLVMMQVLARVTPLESYVWTGELARLLPGVALLRPRRLPART